MMVLYLNIMNIYIDGSSKGNPGPGKAVMHIKDFLNYGLTISKDFKIITNNQAEYQALILALDYIQKNHKHFKDRKIINILTDSQLIDGHINKNWKVNKNCDLVEKAKDMVQTSKIPIKIMWISRNKNLAGILIENGKV